MYAGGGAPSGALAEKIAQEFGGFEEFGKLFLAASNSAPASGWGVLAYHPGLGRMQVLEDRDVVLALGPQSIRPLRPGRLGFEEPGVLNGESREVAEGIEQIGVFPDEPGDTRSTDHDQGPEDPRSLAQRYGQDRSRFTGIQDQGFIERIVRHVVVYDRPVLLDRPLAESALDRVSGSRDSLERPAGSRDEQLVEFGFEEGDGRTGAVEQQAGALGDDGQNPLQVRGLQDGTARLA